GSIGRITCETSADMVVYAASEHLAQAEKNSVTIADIPLEKPSEPERIHEWRIGEFRRSAKPAVFMVDQAEDIFRQLQEGVHGETGRPGGGGEICRDVTFQPSRVCAQFLSFFPPGALYGCEDLGEARPAVARLAWKIGTAPER